MKKFSLILTLVFGSIIMFAQEQATQLEKANRSFLLNDYDLAQKIYSNLLGRSNKTNPDILRKLAVCYEKTNQYQNAINTLEALTKTIPLTDGELELLGDMYKSLGQYANAKSAYQNISNFNMNKIAMTKYSGCDSAMKWKSYADNKVYNIKNINSQSSEFGPKMTTSNQLVFNSSNIKYGIIDPQLYRKQKKTFDWSGENFQKLYQLSNLGTSKEEVVNFSQVINNSNYHVSDIVFNRENTVAYITYTNPEGDYVKASEQKLLDNNIKKIKSKRLLIYMSKKANSGWSQPEPINLNEPLQYNISHPALSPDGNYLFFTSDRPDGFGENDIWYSKKTDDKTWSKPVNCGSAINTTEEEGFPYIDDAGNLYFSSKGLLGMGGLDIFKCTYKNNQWSKPENLKSPINSEADDFSYSDTRENSDFGFLASNRSGGVGSDDIYGFIKNYKQNKQKQIHFAVRDEETNQPIDHAQINIVNKASNFNQTVYSDKNGEINLPIMVGETYDITANKNTYRPYETSVSISPLNPNDVTVDIPLIKQLQYKTYQSGQTFELKNLYYDFDKFNIRPDAARILDELVVLMRDNYPNMKILLQSNTDSRGTSEYNMKLSKNRAIAAYNYLISKGISPSRIKKEGLGETNPVNKCVDGVPCEESEYNKNRRTEIKILEL